MSVDPRMKTFLAARPVAVVGASDDRAVLAVNPKGGVIEGEPAYPSLAECPKPPRRVWFQEGSADREVLHRAHALNLQVVHEACIMVMAARQD